MKLTDKQEMFIQEYLIDLNATQAAIRAGYSKETAAVIGHENLIKPYIQEAIEKAQKERMERVLVTQDDILNDLIEIKQRCMEKNQESIAIKSLELLGKHLGMFSDKGQNDRNIKITFDTPDEANV